MLDTFSRDGFHTSGMFWKLWCIEKLYIQVELIDTDCTCYVNLQDMGHAEHNFHGFQFTHFDEKPYSVEEFHYIIKKDVDFVLNDLQNRLLFSYLPFNVLRPGKFIHHV